uniref:Uncharacterized protein n=1 Tax=Ursus americanus TaxID=9643 RepID=A0A452Q7C5_URSAM
MVKFLASFTQKMNIKCCEFLCQVVQKYIINNLVKKKRKCKPSRPVYSMFVIFSSSRPITMGLTRWLRKKREGEVASTAIQRTAG